MALFGRKEEAVPGVKPDGLPVCSGTRPCRRRWLRCCCLSRRGTKRIGKEGVAKAIDILTRYKQGKANLRDPHCRGRAVVGAAPLGKPSGAGRQQGPADRGRGAGADVCLAVQLHHQQARRRHGQLPGAGGAAQGAQRRGERKDPLLHPAGGAGVQRVRADPTPTTGGES